MNDQNLIPITQLPESEQREMRRRAGIKSGETRRRKRDARTQMLALLKCMPQLDDRTVENLKKLGFTGKGREKDKFAIETIAYGALLQKAMKGDVGAHRLILEIIGEDAQTKRMQAQMEHEMQMMEHIEQACADDGFIEVLSEQAAEVFAGGVDEPKGLDD